ncbi:LamG domain-containing protein [Actinomadura sp. NPDC048021]|uniref:LamG domain-containing protein n=1 Tax=Actinomadura sp. NPDC048021 TaxID=3155385 RepID=UPI0033E3CE22
MDTIRRRSVTRRNRPCQRSLTAAIILCIGGGCHSGGRGNMAQEIFLPEDMRSGGEFVSSLRRLKQWSGFSYRQLERRAEAAGDTLPRSTIAQALTGDTLPRRETVEAFVRACLGPEQAMMGTPQWLAAYDRLAEGNDLGASPRSTLGTGTGDHRSHPDRPKAQRRSRSHGRPPTGPRPPRIRDAEELMDALRHLKRRSGFSYRQLERRAEAAGDSLPRSTIAQALTGDTLPRRETVEAFVRACLGPEQAVTEAAQWLAAYDRLAGDGSPAHAMPPAQTFLLVDTRPVRPQPRAAANRPRNRIRRYAVALSAAMLLLLSGSAAPPLAAPAAPAAEPVAWWRFDDPENDLAADSEGRHPLRTAGRASRIAAPSGQALLLDGTAHTTAQNAVFRTDLDFTVTAWVRLDAGDGWGTVLSVHHGDFDVFLLSYDSDKGRWAILVPNQATGWADGDQTVFSRERPKAGTWTHLAAVYDLKTRQLRLYVNGELSATRSCRRLVRATGPLEIGRALEQGRPLDHWRGGIDDVRVFDRALVRSQVRSVLLTRT